jgi:hypothetical protein
MRKCQRDFYAFLLSCLILAGGGYLATRYPELRGEIAGVVSIVVGWWFAKAVRGTLAG